MSRSFANRRFLEAATLVRQEPGRDNEYGEWVSGEETRTEITVVSAPPDAAKTRDVLPEGVRLSESRMFWIEGVEVKPLRTGTDATEGDVIEHQGTCYRVNQVEQCPGFVDVLGVREGGSDQADDTGP